MFGKSYSEPKNTETYTTPPPLFEPEPAPAPAPKPEPKIDTIIGEGTRIVGTVTCKTLLRVDGIIEGEIISESKVVVSEKGLVKGDISAENMTLGGELTGNAHVREKSEILATGRLHGDIITKTLIMDENAIFEGKCTMNQSALEKMNRIPDVKPEHKPEPKAEPKTEPVFSAKEQG